MSGEALETFTEPREFVEHSRYSNDRRVALTTLTAASIDEPIVDLISGFNSLPHCFTLQCCYGHFLCFPDQDLHSLEPIPRAFNSPVKYRIAYIAYCIEQSDRGIAFRQALARIPAIAPDYIQFGSADWFWDSHPNTYALQVMPDAYKSLDEAVLEPSEAFHTQETRGQFFMELRSLLDSELI